MADYISTLNGSQMDAALLDMAEHNSEAYAVGERNGVPVDNNDVTYHNNARYYAQQAQSIAPASVTEAVRWDVAQTALTDAQREQARENIKAANTNPNLLDNPWWGSGEVVNQRGVTSGNTDHLAYNIDRWQTSYGSVKGTWSLSANGLTISASDVAYNQQKIENYAELNGKTVTASVMTSDGVVHSRTVTNLNWASNTIAFTDGNLRCQLASGGIFRVTSLNGSSNTIRAVKLELGTVSTLAYDSPTDYGEELTRCIYSTADPTDTYANNGFGRTNPNLLDNWWFAGSGTGGANPINQRGSSSYTGTGQTHFIDRWVLYGTAALSTGGITIREGTYNNGAMSTYIETSRFDLNSPYTISALLSDGTFYKATGLIKTDDINWYISVGAVNNNGIALRWQTRDGISCQHFAIWNTGNNRKVIAAKIEKGTVSTLMNDTPPDYGTELAKCQRYFVRIPLIVNQPTGFGFAHTATSVRIGLPISVTMRSSASVTSNGAIVVRGNGSQIAVTTVENTTAQNIIPTGQANIACNVASGLAGNAIYCLSTTQAGAYIDLSADL